MRRSFGVHPQTASDAPWHDVAQRTRLSVEELLPASYELLRRTWQSHDTATLELRPQGRPLPTMAAPGQFYMLYVFGVGEVPISITGIRRDGGLRFTVRDVGAVTRALARLRKGEPVGVRGPFGCGWPMEQAQGRDVLLIAGGLGLAPLMPALQELRRHRKRYGRIALLCGARTPHEVVFGRELRAWRARDDVQVLLTVDAAEPGWQDDVGVVTELIAKAHVDPSQSLALICGPPIMMRFSARDLSAWGVPRERIFLSLERNMRCALGYCGHCQLGPYFVCRDGPVLPLPRLQHWIGHKEL